MGVEFRPYKKNTSMKTNMHVNDTKNICTYKNTHTQKRQCRQNCMWLVASAAIGCVNLAKCCKRRLSRWVFIQVMRLGRIWATQAGQLRLHELAGCDIDTTLTWISHCGH